MMFYIDCTDQDIPVFIPREPGMCRLAFLIRGMRK